MALIPLGVSFEERMRGSWRETPAGPRGGAFGFDLRVERLDLRLPVPVLVGEARGTVTMAGIVEQVAAEGRIELSPILRQRVRYQLTFAGPDGRPYRFRGAKRIRLQRLLESWTTLPGTVEDLSTGNTVGRVIARFDLQRQLLPLMRSVRRAGATHREVALAFLRAMLPPVAPLPGGDEQTLAAAQEILAGLSPWLSQGNRLMLRGLDLAAVAFRGRRFARLALHEQQALLQRWENHPLLRWPLLALGLLYKTAHFDAERTHAALDVPFRRGGPAEPVRWLQQVRRGDDLTADEELECDVVVVGTGAGGAVVGRELAQQGHAVVFIEEGELYRRDAFDGSAVHAHRRFYRGKAGIASIGNTVIPILMGRLVGGSTAINTGTCFRTPPWILERWCEDLGSDAFSPAHLAPHFDRVEQQLGVETAREQHLGGVARVVARGCEQLAWHHFPLQRNAPDCDGQGLCDFGCPSDAKRSTNISYIPPALQQGALLMTRMRAQRVLLDGKRAVGVEARTKHGRTVRVRARATIIAGGAIPTPLLLLAQGLANSSGQLGRNLSLHPATGASALFDEPIMAHSAIPQGYGCDEFHRAGILLLGASAPVSAGALMFPFAGQRMMELMANFGRVASFGAMVEDESRGRVRRGPGGRPLITYWLDGGDVGRLQQGLLRIAEIFCAAGARRLFPLLPRLADVEPRQGLEALRTMRLRASDFLLTSFHPLGTCRMGSDPRTSVVDLDHQCHDVPGLYIVDGSVLPGPPAVNPQITIMALADRAAERIASLLG